jgi:hypothetical protein
MHFKISGTKSQPKSVRQWWIWELAMAFWVLVLCFWVRQEPFSWKFPGCKEEMETGLAI